MSGFWCSLIFTSKLAFKHANDDDDDVDVERSNLVNILKWQSAWCWKVRSDKRSSETFVGKMLRFGFIKIKNNNSSNYYIGLLPQTKNEDYWVQKDTNLKIHILAILNSLLVMGGIILNLLCRI